MYTNGLIDPFGPLTRNEISDNVDIIKYVLSPNPLNMWPCLGGTTVLIKNDDIFKSLNLFETHSVDKFVESSKFEKYIVSKWPNLYNKYYKEKV